LLLPSLTRPYAASVLNQDQQPSLFWFYTFYLLRFEHMTYPKPF